VNNQDLIIEENDDAIDSLMISTPISTSIPLRQPIPLFLKRPILNSSNETQDEIQAQPQNITFLRATLIYKEPNRIIIPPDARKPLEYDMCQRECGRYLTVVSNHGARFGHYFTTW